MLKTGMVRLHLRGGAGGGILARFMTCEANAYVKEVKHAPLDMVEEPAIHDPGIGFCDGGYLLDEKDPRARLQ